MPLGFVGFGLRGAGGFSRGAFTVRTGFRLRVYGLGLGE